MPRRQRTVVRLLSLGNVMPRLNLEANERKVSHNGTFSSNLILQLGVRAFFQTAHFERGSIQEMYHKTYIKDDCYLAEASQEVVPYTCRMIE